MHANFSPFTLIYPRRSFEVGILISCEHSEQTAIEASSTNRKPFSLGVAMYRQPQSGLRQVTSFAISIPAELALTIVPHSAHSKSTTTASVLVYYGSPPALPGRQ